MSNVHVTMYKLVLQQRFNPSDIERFTNLQRFLKHLNRDDQFYQFNTILASEFNAKYDL